MVVQDRSDEQMRTKILHEKKIPSTLPVLFLVFQEVRACAHNVCVAFQLDFCSSE
jgi:hypothetical protein